MDDEITDMLARSANLREQLAKISERADTLIERNFQLRKRSDALQARWAAIHKYLAASIQNMRNV